MAYYTFLESLEKTAVFTYGRNNPPTIGHEKLFDKTIEVAKKHGAMPHIFTSHSQDAKKNPLSAEHKVSLIKSAYPEAHVASSSKEMPSMLHIAKHLHEQGHKHLVMVAGSDRVDEYKNKLNQYNGTHEGALYNFKSIKVVSAGQRDPDAEGAAGMSGTKLRSHAIAGNREKFKSGLLSKLSDEKKNEVYDHVRKALNVRESYTENDKIRELYVAGTIFKVGQLVETKDGREGKVSYRGSNYVVVEQEQGMKFKTWLTDIQEKANMQLEFDGIQTKSLDQCPEAYDQLKKLIDTARAGKHVGELTGHEPPPTPAVKSPQSSNVDTEKVVQAGIALKPQHIRHMQFKQYVGL